MKYEASGNNFYFLEKNAEKKIFDGALAMISAFFPEKLKIKILFVGDIMLDRGVEWQMKKNSISYPFEKISPFLKQFDIVFANLEGPIVENPPKFASNSMQFAFSQEAGQAMAESGINLVSLANNHASNMGQEGLLQTKEFLTQQGVGFLGDPIDCEKENIFTKNDLIFLAFNQTFSFNCPAEKIIEIIQRTRSENPEAILIVAMHWGQEYQSQADKTQSDLGHKIISAGADVIFGGHPHVVQNIEMYEPFGATPAFATSYANVEASAGRQGKPIFYSLGNFIFDQYFSQETQESLAVSMEIYDSKIIYRLFPVASQLSQPFLMDKKTKEEFFNKSRNLIEQIAGNALIVEQ